MARIAKQAALTNCICVDNVSSLNGDEFELEMNRVCPVHGFRSLGEIDRIYFVNPDRSVVQDPKFDELVDRVPYAQNYRVDSDVIVVDKIVRNAEVRNVSVHR